ncbi:hypothetical protein ACF0H5_005706 [Mactra antiquata]
MDISLLEPKFQELIKAAVEMKDRAYCPYSNFRVGSSVMCSNGSIHVGCNVENASYGLCLCAERCAVSNAVSAGHTDIIAVAISCDIKGDFKGPCGMCRQVLAEFNLEMDLYLTKPDNTYKKVNLKELLPMAFTPKSLEAERI